MSGTAQQRIDRVTLNAFEKVTRQSAIDLICLIIGSNAFVRSTLGNALDLRGMHAVELGRFLISAACLP